MNNNNEKEKNMKVKQVYNPDFDFICGYIGGFNDVPTKQDKFKPIVEKNFIIKARRGKKSNLQESVTF